MLNCKKRATKIKLLIVLAKNKLLNVGDSVEDGKGKLGKGTRLGEGTLTKLGKGILPEVWEGDPL